MTTSLAADRLEVVRNAEPDPQARCHAGEGGVAVVARSTDGVRLLVAADAGRYSLMLAHAFRREACSPADLPAIAQTLDDTLRRVGQASVCATLVDITPVGLTVLHRGGPTPVVVHADRSLTRLLATLPGPPLASCEASPTAEVSQWPHTAMGDVLLVTTPGAVEPALRAMAAATSPTLPGLWQALREDGPLDAGNAYALVSLIAGSALAA